MREFSPPYGDGTSDRRKQTALMKFSPPYGDGTLLCDGQLRKNTFSPPYGDGTDWYEKGLQLREFSPPYGDSTILDYMGVPTKMFSPPYGDGTIHLMTKYLRLRVFAPLRGWYLKIRRKEITMFSFRPLTGRTLSVTAYAVPAPPKGGA